MEVESRNFDLRVARKNSRISRLRYIGSFRAANFFFFLNSIKATPSVSRIQANTLFGMPYW